MALMGLDFGTTNVKSVIFSEKGEQLASAEYEIEHLHPQQGWTEIRPQDYWNSAKKASKKAISSLEEGTVEAVGLSGLGGEMFPADKDGKPLYNILPPYDKRAVDQLEDLQKELDCETFASVTGYTVCDLSVLNRVIWFKENKPDLLKDGWRIMTTQDYALTKMGVRPVIDYSRASITTPFDLEKKEWSNEILNELNISPEVFPEVVPSEEVVGEISKSSAEELGLSEGVKVVAGGFDQAVSSVGAGLVDPEKAEGTVSTGTFEVTGSLTKEPINADKVCGLTCYTNFSPQGYYYNFNTLPTGGSSLKWFIENIAQIEQEKAEEEGKDIHNYLFEDVEFEGGNNLVLPFFEGSQQNPRMRASFFGLSLETGKKELFKGLVEGTVHSFKENIRRLEKSAGFPIEEVHAVGGGANSDKWLQLKADLTGRVIKRMKVLDSAVLGAAIIAGVGIGVYPDYEDAVEVAVHEKESFTPREKVSQAYEEQHEKYKKMYNLLDGIDLTMQIG